MTDAGICHGWAGIYQTAVRAAQDANDPRLPRLCHQVAASLVTHARPHSSNGTGLLDGATGTALALSTLVDGEPPANGWDACLLID